MNVDSVLRERYIYDLLKKDFDIFARARLIAEYMKEEGLTQSKFAAKFGVPKTTVHTWLLVGSNEEEYKQLREEGFSKTQAFKTVRGDKVVALTDLEEFLTDVRRRVRSFKMLPTIKHSPATFQLIDETVNDLNVLAVEIKLREKRK